MDSKESSFDFSKFIKNWGLVFLPVICALAVGYALLYIDGIRAFFDFEGAEKTKDSVLKYLAFLQFFVATGITLSMYEYKKSMSKFIRKEVGSEIKKIAPLLSTFNSYFSLPTEGAISRARDKIFNSAKDELIDLASGKITLIGDNKYYEWLKERFTISDESSLKTVRAISCRPLKVYKDTPNEKEFLNDVDSAVQRGVQFTRIFVAWKEELLDKEARGILLSHYNKFSNLNSQKTKIKTRDNRITDAIKICWIDDHPPHMTELNGGGFSIYNDSEVFYDCSYFPNTIQNTGGFSNRQGSNVATKPVFPEATVFFGSHKRKQALIKAYQDVSKSCSNISSYLDLCKAVREYAEGLLQSSKDEIFRANFSQLVSEIAALESKNTTV